MAKKRDVIRALRDARDLISDAGRWCAGQLAVDRTGGAVATSDPRACRFCAMGAVLHCSPTGNLALDTRITKALDKAANWYGYNRYYELNDHAGHARVLEMFDRAIESES